MVIGRTHGSMPRRGLLTTHFHLIDPSNTPAQIVDTLALNPVSPAGSYYHHHGTRARLEGGAQRVKPTVEASAIQISLTDPRVTDLRPNDSAESPFYYTFKVQCTSCRETHPNFVTMSRFEVHDVSGSRGEANFVWKCKNCKVNLTPPLRQWKEN